MNPYTKSCAFVNKERMYVFLMPENIKAVAVKIALQDWTMPLWRGEIYPEDDLILEFLGVACAVNFCFTDPVTKKKFDVEYPEGSGRIWYGADALIACLKRALDEGLPILESGFLRNLTMLNVRKIFRCHAAPIPMIRERLLLLIDAGRTLATWVESFSRIFEGADFKLFDGSQLGIVQQLAALFPASYQDIGHYHGQTLFFHKKAQLFPMMYHARALSSRNRLRPIADPENFGVPADYQLPKTLRILGIMFFDPELAEKIDGGELIDKGSNFENEIRAQTVNGMARLLGEINVIRASNNLNPITMAELDAWAWFLARDPKFCQMSHHLTITTSY